MVLPSTSASTDSAADQAAVWFARQRSGSWSAQDAAEFAAWLKADFAHTAAWASYEQMWERLESVRDNPSVLAIREQARANAARYRGRRRRWRLSAAIAAGVILATSSWWTLHNSSTAPTSSPLTAFSSTSIPSALVRDASTQVGERSILVLADGSKVTLNTASAIHADYTGQDRRVTLLRGEAYFDVAKDHSRPFIVFAGPRQVIALGTAFDVRLQDGGVKVTLVEGRVRVVPTAGAIAAVTPSDAAPVVLEPGYALLASEGGTDRIQRLDTVRATTWTSGKLVFEDERLADVIAEVNRYSRERFEIADPALAERRISGVFESNSGPAFAKALEDYGIARVGRQTSTEIVLESATSDPP